MLRNVQKFWWEEYGTSIAADGAMYRGQEPLLYDSPDRRLLAGFGLGDPREQRQVRIVTQCRPVLGATALSFHAVGFHSRAADLNIDAAGKQNWSVSLAEWRRISH